VPAARFKFGKRKEAEVKYVQSAKEVCSRFLKDRSGNFAITMALAAIPIFGLTGMAIDYSRLADSRADYQNAIEAGAISAAIAVRTKPWATAELEGRNAFAAAMLNTDASGLSDVTFTYDANRQRVSAKAKGRIPTTLSAVVGVSEFNFDVESEVVLPNYPIEVALVLDTTDSMSVEGKMNALKTSATRFVDTLKANPLGDVKIGVAPFAEYARVNTAFQGQDWLQIVPFSVITQAAGWVTTNVLVSRTNCRNIVQPVAGYWTGGNWTGGCTPGYWTAAVIRDGVIITPSVWVPERCTPRVWVPRTWVPPTTRNVTQCDDVWRQDRTWRPEIRNNYTWRGCVGSRPYPLNLKDERYNESKIPGLAEIQTCSNQITPLSSSATTVKAAINALTTSGSTYIPAGLIWGVNILSSHQPYSEARSQTEMAERNGEKYLILMTDGDNTLAPVNDTAQKHADTNLATARPRANRYTSEACEYAKAQGITVYTVSFGSGLSAPTKAMLRNCASNPQNYFDATSGGDLATAFQAIAEGILKLYVSK
jgi:Flp pilus assembly protein TadG